MKKKFCIVVGEPNSVNSEIIAKSWKKISSYKKKHIFFVGNYDLINKQFRRIKIKILTNKLNSINDGFSKNKLNILNVPLKFKNPFTVNERESSRYVLKSLNMAHNLSIKKEIKGFINCPVDKKSLFKSKNIGVTEYLSKKNRSLGREVMLIYNSKMSVAPVTTHLNIKQISKNITKNLIQNKIISLNYFYKKYFKKKPVIAVLGLNPHNGESRSDTEEQKVIKPCIKKLRNKNLKIIGPFPADTIFLNKKKYYFDVIVGMYHDQVLAPYKALFGLDAINITLGLSYVRVSPDHGTAKDLIGLGKADPTSLIKSINFISKI